MKDISHKAANILDKYYKGIFLEHKATPQGVGWVDQESLDLRYSKMLDILNNDTYKTEKNSLLDVGCGYGGLWSFIKSKSMEIEYIGLDALEVMINYCRNAHPDATFICSNILDFNIENKFDYVVCNGILTMKRELTQSEMNIFCHQVIEKMFQICKYGIAFNVHTSYVNFYDNQHFYKSPVEMLAYCLENFSNKVKIDHSYPLYDYTTFIYKTDI